jgi:aspartyl-tRNA(Asn)/glutamyl-tRNA(Gln) amidotransferase subunit A
MATDNLGKSIAQLSILIQSGVLDPRALAEDTLSAISAYDDPAIFTLLTPERAMIEAEASAARLRAGRSRGMLEGIPIAWKDLFDLKDITTTAGAKVLAAEAPARSDADVVEALSQAGMVVVGKTNMSEFAFSGLGVNPHFGTPRNPRARGPARITGGSSSGAGAAVAAGLVPAAIGTDTGGSIRIPAAFNGVVGYKATRGRYAMRGVFPLAKSLDSLGPLCRTIQDAIWLDAGMRGLSATSVRRTPLAGQHFVIPETIFFDDIEPEVHAVFEAAVERIAAAGGVIRRQVFPVITEIFDLMQRRGALVTAEAYVLHRARLEGREAEGMDPRVVARARLGANISLSDYLAILERREAMTAEFARQIAPGELILSPTLPHVAPLTGPLLEDDDLFFKTNGKTLRNTLIGNFLDWCGVSLPCGTGAHGMPVGLMLSGLAHGDDAMLGAALSLEEVVAA